jgi:hypothetical protein
MARVVGSYLRDLDLVTAEPGTLSNGEDVAVVLGSGYQLPPPESEGPVECP